MIPSVKISDINKILNTLSSKVASEPFNEEILSFLDELSQDIKRKKVSLKYPELISFSFFCRRANLDLLKKKFNSYNFRIGKGIVFHITPTNIPINFAYSLVFGLLAGNNNIVRVPSKNYDQVNIINNCLNKISKKKKFRKIKKSFFLIKYARNEEITKLISSKSDVRVIWGGDDTIRQIKSIPVSERALDIAFADRYSFSMINCEKLKDASHNEINQLANKFFNDTYLVDQNACSSPHLIFWIGKYNKKKVDLFWSKLSGLVSTKYKFVESSAFEKYHLLIKNLIEKNDLEFKKRYSNYLYRINVKKVDKNIVNLRGKFGMFYEHNLPNISLISKLVSRRVQTITYSGFEKKELYEFFKKEKLSGVDRIVPIGTALDISPIWDGYDIIKILSREIEIK